MRVKITHQGKDYHIDWDKSVPPTKEEARKIAEDILFKEEHKPINPMEEIKNSPIGKAASWLFSSPESVQNAADEFKKPIDEGSGPLFFNWGQGNDIEGGREFAKNIVDFATPSRLDIGTAGLGLAAKPVLKGVEKFGPKVLKGGEKIIEAIKAAHATELGSEAGVLKIGGPRDLGINPRAIKQAEEKLDEIVDLIASGEDSNSIGIKLNLKPGTIDAIKKKHKIGGADKDIEDAVKQISSSPIEKASDDVNLPPTQTPAEEVLEDIPSGPDNKLHWKDTLDFLGPFQRSVQSMGEMSRPLRQAKIPTLFHPRSSGPAFKNMFKAALNPDHVAEVMREVDSRPFANISEFKLNPKTGNLDDVTRNLYREAGLRVSDLEEAFPSRLAEKLPGLRQITKRSEAAYQAYGDTLLPNEFDRIMSKYGFSPTNLPDNETLRQIGNTVNTLAGSGGGGKAFEEAVPIAQKILYSPRYQKSQVDLLNPWNYSGSSSRFGEIGGKELRRDAGLFGAGAVGGIAGLDALSDDVDVIWNPLDSDFAKIKIGDTRFNPLGAVNPLIRTGSRLAKNAGNFAFGDDFNELIEPLVGEESANKKVDAGRELANFGRSKLAPGLPTLLGDYFAGQRENKETGEMEMHNVVGEPLRDENYFGKNFETPYLGHTLGDNTPLYYQELGEIANSENPELNWLAAPLGFFGADSNTYKKREPKPKGGGSFDPYSEIEKVHKRLYGNK